MISGIFLAGDLNSQENQEAYSVLTAPESSLADSINFVKPAARYGYHTTWSGFGYEGLVPGRIDYVLLGPANRAESRDLPWKIEGYAVLENVFEDGVYNSDHRAVVVDALLRG
jgi:endonuclease/exonuclease/phosphatase family metal-dependent hydrolase